MIVSVTLIATNFRQGPWLGTARITNSCLSHFPLSPNKNSHHTGLILVLTSTAPPSSFCRRAIPHSSIPSVWNSLSSLHGSQLPRSPCQPTSYHFREFLLSCSLSWHLDTFFTENTSCNYFLFVFSLPPRNPHSSPYHFIYHSKSVPSTVPDT